MHTGGRPILALPDLGKGTYDLQRRQLLWDLDSAVAVTLHGLNKGKAAAQQYWPPQPDKVDSWWTLHEESVYCYPLYGWDTA